MLIFLLGCGLAGAAERRVGISANPGAVTQTTGTGEVARALGLKRETGVFVGGLWVADTNYVIAGGAEPGAWSANSLLIVSVRLDAENLVGWKGGTLGAEFLQFNGQRTNQQAGSAQGYNALPGAEPLQRSELYQLWVRQDFFDGKLILRGGKMNPTADFNNVLRPVPTQDKSLTIPAVSGLGFTPIFKNPSLIGVMPGSYNSAAGVTVTFAPQETLYLRYGFYDGNLANGVQTGLMGPQFTGYYFQVLEAGAAWEIAGNLPGAFGIGAWHQSGLLRGPGVTEEGAMGGYLFASQRLWRQHPGRDHNGVSGYVQFGANDSITLPFNQYFGLGFTGFGLVPARTEDSAGVGLAWSWLNPREFSRGSELMLQGYYQAHLFAAAYLQPSLTYIPTPAAGANLGGAWASTLQLAVLF